MADRARETDDNRTPVALSPDVIADNAPVAAMADFSTGLKAGVTVASIGQVDSDNLLTNPSFEEGTVGWTPSSCSGTSSNAAVSDGALSILLAPLFSTLSIQLSSDPIGVPAGAEYLNMSADLQTNITIGVQASAHLNLAFYDDTSTLIGAPSVAPTTNAIIDGSIWTQLSGAALVPDGAVTCILTVWIDYISFASGTDSIFVDNCNVSVASTLDGVSRGLIVPTLGIAGLNAGAAQLTNTATAAGINTFDDWGVEVINFMYDINWRKMRLALDMMVRGRYASGVAAIRQMKLKVVYSIDGGVSWLSVNAHSAQVFIPSNATANNLTAIDHGLAIFDGTVPVSDIRVKAQFCQANGVVGDVTAADGVLTAKLLPLPGPGE